MLDFDTAYQSLANYAGSGQWLQPLKALLGAFVFGQAVAWTYEATYRGLSYSRGFGQSLVLIAIGAAILVEAMAYSLIAGVGIFGVLSMIRFRATLKAPRDLVFVLGAASLGTGAGVGALIPSALGALVFCGVALYLHAAPFGSRVRYDGVLRFRVDAKSQSPAAIERVLDRHCRRRVLLSVTEVGQGERVEHTYQVKFWSDTEREALLEALRVDFAAVDARLLMQEATLEY